jgi:hypothetical protein
MRPVSTPAAGPAAGGVSNAGAFSVTLSAERGRTRRRAALAGARESETAPPQGARPILLLPTHCAKDQAMAQRPEDRTTEPRMDAEALYREDIYTDRRVGTIRVLTPVKKDGSPDPARSVAYVGEAQLLTSVGALPVSFEIEAKTLEEAVAKFTEAAKDAVERTVRDLQELRRQAASSILVPQGGMGGLGGLGGGGLPGGGKIQLP